ncbi:cAMP-binding protein [Candidatus Magnetoovum chiemensis]|nr:cAMP-binding protein [Candidatus Magnetoovum chiemensis]
MANKILNSIKEKDNFPIQKFQKKETLFHENDRFKYNFIVKSGVIKLFKVSDRGREFTIDYLWPGDYLLLPCFNGLFRYPFSAVVYKEASIIVIKSDCMKDIFKDSINDLGIELIEDIWSKMVELINKMGVLVFNDVEHRVASVLMKLSEDISSDGDLVYMPFSHNDLASLLGTVREVVSRQMLKLKKEQIVHSCGIKGFTINKSLLREYLSSL